MPQSSQHVSVLISQTPCYAAPQDFCIECPATGSLFSLKDGSIVDWYPGNPVLRALTPKDTCRPMDVYPVKLTQVRPRGRPASGGCVRTCMLGML